MKKITWDNPNKMHFDSEFKTFNKQTNVISTGNVFANTQTSLFIRPYNETECNGRENPKGHLMNFDLQTFRSIPEPIREIIYDKTRERSVILYKFRVWRGSYEDIFAYVITDDSHNYIRHCLCVEYGANYWKRYDALINILPYICNESSIPAEYQICQKSA